MTSPADGSPIAIAEAIPGRRALKRLEPPEPEGSSGSIAICTPWGVSSARPIHGFVGLFCGRCPARRLSTSATRSTNGPVNEQSLRDSNAILAAAGSRTGVGEFIPASPAELARESGLHDRLSVARAMRALMSRGRIAQEGERYRLLDGRPLEPGEPASVRRPVRRRRGQKESKTVEDGPVTYEGIGRAVIERLIEVSADTSELRAALDRARTEADAARKEAVDVRRQAADDRRRAEQLEDEVNALKRRLEMTETNLRTVVEAAKNRPASPLVDTDARAILDILAAKDPGES